MAVGAGVVMSKQIRQLFPSSDQKLALEGLYLNHKLRQYGAASKRPFVYSNYVTSIDGRIAIPHPSGQGQMVPKNIANERDWRLFQELAAQADLIISSGRYLRDWAEGRGQEILEIDKPRFADLRRWREKQGLKPQPDIAIISGSLNFPIPELLTANGRKVVVFTTSKAPVDRVKAIEGQAGQVMVAGETAVDGRILVEKAAQLGYRTIYNATGPKVMHLLLAAGVVDRLYITIANRILGGAPFSSIVEGGLLETAVDFTLNSVYFDPVALNGLGQLYLSYNTAIAERLFDKSLIEEKERR